MEGGLRPRKRARKFVAGGLNRLAHGARKNTGANAAKGVEVGVGNKWHVMIEGVRKARLREFVADYFTLVYVVRPSRSRVHFLQEIYVCRMRGQKIRSVREMRNNRLFAPRQNFLAAVKDKAALRFISPIPQISGHKAEPIRPHAIGAMIIDDNCGRAELWCYQGEYGQEKPPQRVARRGTP